MAGFMDLLRGRGRVYLLEAVLCFGSLVLLLGMGHLPREPIRSLPGSW